MGQVSLTMSRRRNLDTTLACKRGGGEREKLTFGRECWCAQSIAGISAKLDDGECKFPCEGNTSLACGGSLKLSVYRMSSAGAQASPVLLASFLSLVAAFVWL